MKHTYRWSLEEDAYLLNPDEVKTYKEISEHTQRTESAVRARATLLRQHGFKTFYIRANKAKTQEAIEAI